MFYLDLDLGALQDVLDLDDVAETEMQRAAADLTAQTKAKIVEIANERLHSRRGMYLDALSHFQIDENTWCVNLDKSARWIDDGMSEHSMLENLLKSKKAKRAKDGSTYVVVPFQHNKAQQSMTPAQQSLLSTIKTELAKVDTTPSQIETHADGSPRLGLVRKMDVTEEPKSTRKLKIGAGAFGHTAQGPTGIPLLQGVRVYQKEIKKPDGSTGVGRFVMTFRVASSKHKDQGNRWQHPGVEATNIMEEGMRWALDRWDSKIAPALLKRIVASLG
jgi:hypothetical protein